MVPNYYVYAGKTLVTLLRQRFLACPPPVVSRNRQSWFFGKSLLRLFPSYRPAKNGECNSVTTVFSTHVYKTGGEYAG